MSEQDGVYRGGTYFITETDPQQVFTPEDLSDEHLMIAKTARQFADEQVKPVAEAIEQHGFEHSVRLMREAGELGLLSTDIPEQFGGLGLDKLATTVVTENIVRAGSWGLTHGAHTGIGTLPIVFFGTKAQKEEYLPGLATGETIAAYALTEAGSGSDAMSARTTAVLTPDGAHYVLNGTKQWITNAGFADVFIVYAKVDGEKFTAFIVEKDDPGVSTGAEEVKMGIKGSSTRTLILEDVKVPADRVLGEIGRGHIIAFNILNIGRWKLAAGAVGGMKRVLEVSAQYAKEREQFGKPIASFRLIQQKLADMAIRTFVAESMVYRTAGDMEAALGGLDPVAEDAGREAAARIADYAIECSVNKVFGSEALDFVVDEGVQIHGGYGYMQEYEVETAYRDSRINRIFEGTNEINRLLIPGTLLRRTLKGELPVMQHMTALQEELLDFFPDLPDADVPLEAERMMLSHAKKVFLMLAGLGVQKYQQKIEEEQELLAGVADIGIAIYAMESALLRAAKALAARGAEGAANLLDMARAYTYEAFERIALIGRNCLAVLDDGDMLRTQLAILRKLTRYEPVNLIELKRAVAARVLEKDGYVA